MLQVSLEKQLFVCLLNRESFDRVRPKEGVCFKQEKRMVPAERILIKEDWMDFSLKLVIFVNGVLFSFFHFFFVDNFLVV